MKLMIFTMVMLFIILSTIVNADDPNLGKLIAAGLIPHENLSLSCSYSGGMGAYTANSIDICVKSISAYMNARHLSDVFTDISLYPGVTIYHHNPSIFIISDIGYEKLYNIDVNRFHVGVGFATMARTFPFMESSSIFIRTFKHIYIRYSVIYDYNGHHRVVQHFNTEWVPKLVNKSMVAISGSMRHDLVTSNTSYYIDCCISYYIGDNWGMGLSGGYVDECGFIGVGIIHNFHNDIE